MKLLSPNNSWGICPRPPDWGSRLEATILFVAPSTTNTSRLLAAPPSVPSSKTQLSSHRKSTAKGWSRSDVPSTMLRKFLSSNPWKLSRPLLSGSEKVPNQVCRAELPAELTQTIPESTARSTVFARPVVYGDVPSPGPSNHQDIEALITDTPSDIIQSTASLISVWDRGLVK